MSTVLFIKSHPLDEHSSISVAVGRAFLQAYRETHPQDEVVELDLYQEWIPQMDRDVLQGRARLLSGAALDELNEQEQQKLSRLDQLVDQFIAADKYVFVSPMWNFSYPPQLKAYIDAIFVAGKTFKYTEQRPIGLLANTGRKAVHVQSSGGYYLSGRPMAQPEAGHYHLKLVLQFFGIEQVDGIFIEGIGVHRDRVEELKQEAIARAVRLASGY